MRSTSFKSEPLVLISVGDGLDDEDALGDAGFSKRTARGVAVTGCEA